MLKSRKRRVALIATAIAATTAAAAIAALLVFRPVKGGGSVVAASQISFTAATQVGTGGGLVDCTVTRDSSTQVTINLDNADAGAFCDVDFRVVATGRDVGLRVQDFRFATLTNEGFVNAGGDPCGMTIPRQGSTPGRYIVRIAIPADASEQTFTVQADAGFYAADSASYNDTACPRAA